jgi:hypothetical protein
VAVAVAELLDGPMAAALAEERDRCNALVAQARRTRSDLDLDRLAALLRGPLTALVEAADRVAPGSGGRVLRATFGPVLELLATHRLDAGPHVALLDALPALAGPVVEQPRLVVASFANALVHLPAHGCSGSLWVERVAAAGAGRDAPTALAAGQLAAWGVGMAHLRTGALAVARDLPAEVRAAALGEPDPIDDASLAGLAADRWAGAGSGGGEPRRVGGFRGFGGPFLEAPTVVATPDGIVVRSGADAWRLHADARGATLTRTTAPPSELGGVDAPIGAVGLWSPFTRLRDPFLCATSAEAEREGLDGSFAMIRLTDQRVVVDVEQVVERGLADLPLEVLAHEVGHHILCPASLTAHGRLLARVRWALPTVEAAAPAVANLYADLHINDRLQRTSGLRMDEVYRRLRAAEAAGRADDAGSKGDLWTLYQRIYEILWGLPRGDLAPAALPDRIEGDAHLGSRLVRAYREDWLDGAAGFGALCLPYLTDDADARAVLAGWGDALGAAGGIVPDGLTELDPGEQGAPLHPARDPRVSGRDAAGPAPAPADAGSATGPGGHPGQHREPFAYGELLRALGIDLDDHQAAVRYYREAARPHLIPFPTLPSPVRGELVPEGRAPWTVGEPLADVDWLGTVLRSPVVIPGVTTVKRVHGPAEDARPREVPLDLDIYVDSSGSIPNPQVQLSFLALAGSVIALSCLRSGGRVQATLWSGARQWTSTDGFTTDADAVLRVVTGYFGGATAFPIHVLRDTYADRKPEARKVHVLVISDDGVTTMFDADERGDDGAAIARRSLDAAGGGGTMVLNLWRRPDDLDRAEEMGWAVEEIAGWDELTAFARRFARRTYASTP